MTTLENLYYGNIAPHEFEVVCGSEYDITAKLVIRHEQELSATLTEQQNVILQKIKDNHTELMNLRKPDAPCFALCRSKELVGHVPDLARQTPHRRFVAVCGQKKDCGAQRPQPLLFNTLFQLI